MFQFPSNGKALSDDRATEVTFEPQDEFQFPSNGKALSDFEGSRGDTYR